MEFGRKSRRKFSKENGRKRALTASANNILDLHNQNIFGGKGAVIVEEIEVDEEGNFLGKNYRMMYDKRPRNLLANPYDFNNVNSLFDANDLVKLREKERRMQKTHKRLKKMIQKLNKEREYLKRKQYKLRQKEEYLMDKGLELSRVDSYEEIQTLSGDAESDDESSENGSDADSGSD